MRRLLPALLCLLASLPVYAWNAAGHRLVAVIAWQQGEDGSFELFDVAGAQIPALADIIASLRLTPSKIRVHFAPDHLNWNGEAIADEGDMVLMLRGAEDLLPQKPFALPPMAEF